MLYRGVTPADRRGSDAARRPDILESVRCALLALMRGEFLPPHPQKMVTGQPVDSSGIFRYAEPCG